MKLKAFISDSDIKGEIRSVYSITNEILIVSTNSFIYTLVFLPPAGAVTALYFIANELAMS